MSRIYFTQTSFSPVPDFKEAIETARELLSNEDSACTACLVELKGTICNWDYKSELLYTFEFECREGA